MTMDVIGFQVMRAKTHAKHKDKLSWHKFGRLFSVKSAAEKLAELTIKTGSNAYVLDVVGSAESEMPKTIRKVRK